MVSKTNLAVVTGVKAETDSPIQVVGCENPDANGYCRGKVSLDLSMGWTRQTDVAGSEVVKDISGNNELQVGHVVEGIEVSGLLQVSGTQAAAGGEAAGIVTLTGVDPTSITRQLDVVLVALNGAVEAIYESAVPYVGLPSGRATDFMCKLHIPQLSMTQPKADLDIWFAMIGAGTPPTGVTVSYVTLAAPDTPPYPSLPASGDFKAPADLGLETFGSLSKGDYFKKTALSAIDITSEQILLFKIARSESDAYASELGVVKMVATIYDAG